MFGSLSHHSSLDQDLKLKYSYLKNAKSNTSLYADKQYLL